MKKSKNIKKTEMIGVDISADAIRLLELAWHDNAIFMTACAKVPYQKNTENLNAEETVIVSALKQGLDGINGHQKMCAIALPDTAVIMRESMLDITLKEKEILAWISEEAGRGFNLPPEALAIDFNVRAIDKNNKILAKNAVEVELCKKRKVQWVAARKDEVYRKISVLERAGLIVKAVDVTTFCLQRVGKKALENLSMFDHLVGLAHFDKQFLSFVILKRGEVLYAATESYQDPYRESARTLLQMINVFLSVSMSEKIYQIFLVGNFFSLEEIRNKVQIPVSILDVFSIFPNMWKSCEDKKKDAHEFAISLGLAMRIKNVN